MSSLTVVPPPPDDLTDRVAAEVRAHMARVRMSQVRLSEILGLPQTSVSKRLRAVIPFRVDELQKVSDALGVHPAVLLGGSVGNNPSPSGGATLGSLRPGTTQSDRKQLTSLGYSGELLSGGIAA